LSEKLPEKGKELQKILDEKLAKTNVKFPEPNPDNNPKD
jgi:hypothetical protein